MPSPFHYGNPVHPTHFLGRRRALARILDRLAHSGASTAVVGEPRAGKTSVLDYLVSPQAHDSLHAGDRALVIVSYLDAHAFEQGLDHASFWSLAVAPLDAPDGPLHADGPARAKLCAMRESGFQPRDIKLFLAALQTAGIRLVLLLDELDYLVQHCVRDPQVFFGRLRSITTLSHGALALVVASRRPLAFLENAAQGAGYTGSPFFNFLAEEILPPFTPDETTTLLARAAGRFSAEDEQLVRDLSGGLPYLAQLLADALWRAHDAGEPDPAARRAEAAAIAAGEAARVLGDIWRLWSPSQRYVVASIAAAHLAPSPSFADVSRFPDELDALQAQGFVAREGGALRVGPRLLFTWCLGELARRSRAGDVWQALAGEGGGAVPLSREKQQAWAEAVRAALAGTEALAGGPPSVPRRAALRRRFKLFLSYAHEDDRHRDHLDRHLASLRREGSIDVWYDARIAPGEDWRARIGEALREADVILLLISADFIASDFCVDVEMEHAVERHRQGTARVVPIAVRAVDWGRMPFEKLKALPRDRKPVTLWADRDEAWKDVADGIREVIASLSG